MAASISEFERHWTRLTQGLGPIQDRVRREIAQSGESARAASEARMDDDDPWDSQDAVEDYVKARGTTGQRVLLGPLGEWERRQPLRQFLLGFGDYHRALDDQIQRVPERIQVRGEELAAVLRPLTGNVRFLRIWGRGTKPRSIPLRNLIHRGISSADGDQLLLQRRFAFALTRSLEGLVDRWRRTQYEIDTRMSERSGKPHDRPGSSEPSTTRYVTSHTQTALAEWDRLAEALPHAVARTIAAGILWPKNVAPPAEPDALPRQVERWTVILDSIEGELRFERNLLDVEQELLRLCMEGCDSIEAERRILLDRIDAMAAWLSDRPVEASAAETPPPGVPGVAPASSRHSEIRSHVHTAMESLPVELRLVRRVEPSTDRALVWKRLRPAELARETFDEVATPRLNSLLDRVQTEHLALVRKLDQALQIVDYGTRSQEGSRLAEDAAVAREAIENALGLLKAEQESVTPDSEHERQFIREALARFFVEYRFVLQRTRLGALAWIRALGLRRAVTSGLRHAIRSLLVSARFMGRTTIWLYHRFLITIHWIPPQEPDAIEIVRRPFLSRELIVDLSDREIPSIYRRLFRFEAVEDPRFLTGRDEELAAISEARSQWDTGRPVALLTVGTRGSGKTSLINCALSRSFPGLEVLRGEFSRRVVDSGGLRQSLVEALGLSDPDRIETELRARRRVVVLEEIERTFLREIGGFDAIRELQRLIAATCRTTLWIIACNQRAFNLLDRVVKLGDGFSHRIYTASVSGESLREAIMVRHDLSGLGLQFLPPPRPPGSVLLRRAGAGRKVDPEQNFFQRLEDESSGVFRTAFEIWLSQIEWHRSNLLRVNPLVAPKIEPIIASLSQEDLFNLLAVMQHGSLTADEHARVFRQSRETSRADMDELFTRDLIKPDPIRPGFRIRPSAMRLTRQALHRQNLG